MRAHVYVYRRAPRRQQLRACAVRTVRTRSAEKRNVVEVSVEYAACRVAAPASTCTGDTLPSLKTSDAITSSLPRTFLLPRRHPFSLSCGLDERGIGLVSIAEYSAPAVSGR